MLKEAFGATGNFAPSFSRHEDLCCINDNYFALKALAKA
jgi:hypothetical protein